MSTLKFTMLCPQPELGIHISLPYSRCLSAGSQPWSPDVGSQPCWEPSRYDLKLGPVLRG